MEAEPIVGESSTGVGGVLAADAIMALVLASELRSFWLGHLTAQLDGNAPGCYRR